MLQNLYKRNKLGRGTRRSPSPTSIQITTIAEVFQPRRMEYVMDARLQHSGRTESVSFRINLAGSHFWFVIPKRYPLKSCGYKLYWESKKSMDTQNIRLWRVRSILSRSTFKTCKIPLLKTRHCKVAAIVGLIFTPSIVQLIRYN